MCDIADKDIEIAAWKANVLMALRGFTDFFKKSLFY